MGYRTNAFPPRYETHAFVIDPRGKRVALTLRVSVWKAATAMAAITMVSMFRAKQQHAASRSRRMAVGALQIHAHEGRTTPSRFGRML